MDIRDLKGIGSKKAELFNRLSINDTQDLLDFYPRDYEVYERPVFIKDLTADDVGKMIAIDGAVAGRANVYRAGKYSVTTVLIKDFEGRGIKCKWFNMPYIKKSLMLRARYIFRGYLSLKDGEYIIEQSRLIKCDSYKEMEGRLLPVYHLTKGLSGNTVISAVKNALEIEGNIEDPLPEYIRKKYGLCTRSAAVKGIHFPADKQEANDCLKRIIFDEFLFFALAVLTRKQENLEAVTGFKIPVSEKINAFTKGLKFKLTGAQERAWEAVSKDLASDRPMNRLLQGDVGSGKTIIAVLALFNAAFEGVQGALMAPTEVLARQEANEIFSLIGDFKLPIKADILTGSTTAAEKKKIYARLASGETDIVIGTHALIQKKVDFKNLGIVITDEQHRFGVGQRKALRTKAKAEGPANVLVMSATPIPRTLAWILYGDLDISVMDELPEGRKPIKNALVDTSYRPKAYKFIKDKISEGRQAYIICPMVERGENEALENVIDYAGELQKELGGEVKVGVMYGQMKPDEKIKVMSDFADNKINVLVSTTVIEVGVNVPNATVIMIENAERFGLSQLHQLRGRVGRGEEESFCIFVSDAQNEDAKKRLKIISDTNDGFEIAEKDMELRGPGDFFGVRQSGELNFLLADPARDKALLDEAVKAAKMILDEDPGLEKEKNALLKARLMEYKNKESDNVNL